MCKRGLSNMSLLLASSSRASLSVLLLLDILKGRSWSNKTA